MKLLHRFFSLLVAAAFVAGAHAAAPQKLRSVEGIDEYRLDNGLQLLLVVDDSKPTTTVNLTYRVGSRHESYGETGMAHLLEHLLFKGTPTHPTVWNEFNRRGLAANGSTSVDRTNYTASFAANADNLGWYLGWLADAMVNSNIARQDLDTEMTVVRNEMERGENSASRILFGKLLATMYQWHNYGKTTIGARSDVENVDIPSLQAFYRKHYQPDNATLIVAGKFDTPRVLAAVADSFGKLPRPARRLAEPYTLDPPQDGERSVTLRRVGGVPMIYAGYHVPAGAHPDFAAIELLSLVMGDTPSGRLHKRLVETGIAASAFAFSAALADPGYAVFGAQLGPGQDEGRAASVLLAALESIAAEPVTAGEAERARRKWLKDWEQLFSDPEAIGIALSEAVAQGDWRLFFLSRDRVAAVKAEDVQRVAVRTLLRANRTLATYVPTERPERPPAPERVDAAAQLRDFVVQRAAATAEAFEATPENIERRTQRFSVGGVRAAVLPKASRGGIVHAVLTLRFGDEQTLHGLSETADAVTALLDKGSESLDRQQVQDRLDELRTELSFSNGPGRVTVRIQSRRETIVPALELVAQLLKAPRLPADALEEYRRQALSSIEQQRREPGALAANSLARWGNPYPRGDARYVPTFDEQAADVRAVTLDQAKAFHARFYGASRAEFSAVGDVEPSALEETLRRTLADWRSDAPYARVALPWHEVAPTRLAHATPDKQNATMLVRQALPLNDDHADYAALSLANYLLGGGGSSRIWKRIRESEGLSYDVRSGVSWGQIDQRSVWQASAIFAPQNLRKVETALREEIARALAQGFTEAELADGKRGLMNFRRFGRAQDESLAAALVTNLHVGRTFLKSAEVDAELQALTLERVNEALRRHLDPARFVYSVAGDFK